MRSMLSVTALLALVTLVAGCPPGGGLGATCSWTAENGLSNGTNNWTIVQMYASLSTDNSWGEDRLGGGTLAFGQTLVIDTAPGTWDFRAVDVDGDTYTAPGQTCVAGDAQTWLITLSDID